MTDKPVAILYVPVLHAGYWRSLIEMSNVTDELWLVDDKCYQAVTGRPASIRSLSVLQASLLIAKFAHFRTIKEGVTDQDLKRLDGRKIITANEFIMHQLAEEFWRNSDVEYLQTFLRWDESNVRSIDLHSFEPSTADPTHRKYMGCAQRLARHSSDWWRQVGAVLVNNGKVIASCYNQHLPDEYAPYIDGDPRDVIEAGKDSHISTVLHAEQGIITYCARNGIALAGADLYVPVYPCPMCAKQLSECGLNRIFFETGHVALHANELFDTADVEVIRVQM